MTLPNAEGAARLAVEQVPFAPDWHPPPGETIDDILEERGWTRADLAGRLRLTPEEVADLASGRAPIDPAIATRLAALFGGSVEFWLARESHDRNAMQSKSTPHVTEDRRMTPDDRILIDPAICHGKPVIRGTRVPVSIVVGSLAGGMGFDEVGREYDLTLEDIQAALAFANALVNEESFHPLSGVA